LNPSFLYFAGLSFVTFRAIQVAIDYNKNESLHFVQYFNFLFFIPSFYIGPLDRYKRFTENAENAFTFINTEFIMKGMQELLKGILYKFLIAEFILRYWLSSKDFESLTVLQIGSDIYAYAFFLFFDFAGYSAMAIGMANLVGIDLPFNFNMPFIARNPADFWQRWHASLTSWLTDYFFKPFYKWLSQMKKLKKQALTRQNIAIFFTFFLMAVWNGLEPNFIWSGILYGVYSVVHNTYLVECRKKDKDVVFGNLKPVLIRYISIFIMFNLACIALYIFSGRYL
jgi:membrane protein involved in D-alanine export